MCLEAVYCFKKILVLARELFQNLFVPSFCQLILETLESTFHLAKRLKRISGLVTRSDKQELVGSSPALNQNFLCLPKYKKGQRHNMMTFPEFLNEGPPLIVRQHKCFVSMETLSGMFNIARLAEESFEKKKQIIVFHCFL